MNQFYHEGGQRATAAGSFTRRIGTTTYRVGVHFSRTSRGTASDKIKRIVKREAVNQ